MRKHDLRKLLSRIFACMSHVVENVAVSCGYSTCFAVSACDGLCHLTKIMDRVETQKSTRSTLALKPSVSPPFYPWVTATENTQITIAPSVDKV